MKSNQDTDHIVKKRLYVLTCIIISGLCWYLSNGLTGDYWYLMWIAPVPIIYISIKTTGNKAFFISFISYLIGRLSWFSYLVSVATLIPAIFFTLILSLSFALILVLTRKVILKTNFLLSIFAFPVFFTTFEFLMLRFSADGTATSIAYSQSDILPIIQLASITGILGITFIITFIPSAIAICLIFIKQKSRIRTILVISGALLISVLIFGILRIKNNSDNASIKAGLVVLEEKYHDVSQHPDFLKDTLVTELYINEVSKLAEQGAKLVVLPERAININNETENLIKGMLGRAAKQNHVWIIIGYTNYRYKQEFNSALVINEKGEVVVDYNKVHLVRGLENRFAPGKGIGVFEVQGLQLGISICKDLDFPVYIKKYGSKNINILTIPAWDFGIDDWLHSRMSILRGVENGFSEIRTAREGRLTISDCFGRVNYEGNCSYRQKVTLIGNASLLKVSTFYSSSGDWFGLIVLISAFCFAFVAVKRRRIF
jgi:apolipoprotein N-acyltransferase